MHWEGVVLHGYRGSIAHGTHVPPEKEDGIDDIDIMGVFVAPKSYYLGLNQVDGFDFWVDDKFDCVYYEIRKFLRLLAKGNPNVLSMLWMKPEMYFDVQSLAFDGGPCHNGWAQKLLIENRKLFLSKRLYHSFSGYAYGQLKRMTQYDSPYRGYMGAKRKALVDKYGYDTKNAAHLIRLLRMGVEALEFGELNVWRCDAQQLIDIKTGKWTLTEVQQAAEGLFARMENTKDHTSLPEHPDENAINELCVEIVSGVLNLYQEGAQEWEQG